ncbi:hypothetical protein HMPREF9711_03128 [Myroides odoratimimus CCUG 3837]|uniref:hypothetical protein n=1 Tax=Myroides odoratimimus TaxID=76832 RepID=UPI000280ACDF|nr:hypothetical protein [Myroides odoratimimus]EKB02666.1 hypothetical protein HMPREF9711_03128 [Myroides odoratimimus CCUG 3837]
MQIDLKIPSKWDELTDWQLKKIAAMIGKNGPAFNFMTWLYLNQVKWWQFKKAYQLKIVMNQVPMSELRNHFNWVYTNVDRTIFPKHNKYVAPMDRLVNLTIEEFAVADDLNNMYLIKKDISYLRLLVAVLYKEKGEVYDHLQLENNVKRFKKEKKDFLLAVHIAFNGCKKGIVEKYKHIYPKIKVQQKSNKKAGLLDVVLKMSGQKFGTYQETKTTLVHTFLNELEENIIQQKELKDKHGK